LALLFYLTSFWPGLALDCLLAGLLGEEMNTLPFPAGFWFTCELSVFQGCTEGPCFSPQWGWGKGGLLTVAWVLSRLLGAQMGKELGEGRARKPWESGISGMASQN